MRRRTKRSLAFGVPSFRRYTLGLRPPLPEEEGLFLLPLGEKMPRTGG